MDSDGLAVEDEEHLRSGVVCLASAPAEVMIFQGLPLPLCRAELHLGCPYHISATGLPLEAFQVHRGFPCPLITVKATPCTAGRQTNRLSRNTCDGRLEAGVSRSAALSQLAETRLVNERCFSFI